jgi:hypothetical protein
LPEQRRFSQGLDRRRLNDASKDVAIEVVGPVRIVE